MRATRLVLLSLMLIVIGCASKEKKIQSEQAALYFGAGTQALMTQDYTEALTNLMKANELEPESSEILTNLAMAYYFKDQKDLAVKTLHAALKANKENSDAMVNLASIYLEDGRIADAEKIYREVLKNLTYDKQARTYYNLALIEQGKSRNTEAEKFLRLAIKEDVNYCPAHMKLGMIQFDRRNFKAALATFKDATLGTCFETPAPHYYQALTLVELRRIDEARMKFDEVSTRFKTDVFAVKARTKLVELQGLDSEYRTTERTAPRKVLESPEF